MQLCGKVLDKIKVAAKMASDKPVAVFSDGHLLRRLIVVPRNAATLARMERESFLVGIYVQAPGMSFSDVYERMVEDVSFVGAYE